MVTRSVERIAEMLAASKNNVVVTGAGISTEAGIPDFRGENGIYRILGEDRVMGILHIGFFKKNPQTFYEFYRKYFLFPTVEPGLAHRILADLEKKGYIKAIITQNIDNLHQRAGNERVIPVHGTADRYICTTPGCYGVFSDAYVRSFPEVVPTCSECRGVLKPNVVLFGEPIQNHRYARETILSARVLLVIGSSLTVFPLASFVEEYSRSGRDLIIINKGKTGLDHAATIKLDTDQAGTVLEEICRKLTASGR